MYKYLPLDSNVPYAVSNQSWNHWNDIVVIHRAGKKKHTNACIAGGWALWSNHWNDLVVPRPNRKIRCLEKGYYASPATNCSCPKGPNWRRLETIREV